MFCSLDQVLDMLLVQVKAHHTMLSLELRSQSSHELEFSCAFCFFKVEYQPVQILEYDFHISRTELDKVLFLAAHRHGQKWDQFGPLGKEA
jgi:hypothetical protein